MQLALLATFATFATYAVAAAAAAASSDYDASSPTMLRGALLASDASASANELLVDSSSRRETGSYIENPNSDKVLNIGNGANGQCTVGTSINLYEKNGKQWQHFQISNDGSIESINCPGMVLDVNGGANSKCARGTKIILWDRNGSKGQKWWMNNDISIESKLCPGMALDIKDGDASNGQEIIIWGKNGGSNQEWYLAPLKIKRGSYIENPDSGKVLDIHNGANSQCTGGTSIDLYEKNGEQWQHFQISNDGSVESIYCPGMVLDIKGGANIDCERGTKIILWDRNGSKGQKWWMNNDLSIESKLCPNMVLAIKDRDASNGQEIIIANKNGRSNKEWYLAPLPIGEEIIILKEEQIESQRVVN